MSPAPHPEVAVLARAGVDLYAQPGQPLREQESFRRYIGSCGANTAVGIARLGARCRLVTSVGDDGHGEYLRAALAAEGVVTDLLRTAPTGRTPLTFASIGLDGESELTAYRTTPSPDHLLDLSDDDVTALLDTPVLYLTGTGFAAEPSRALHQRLLQERAHRLVLDLDWRSAAWPKSEHFGTALAPVVPYADVVLGNTQEWDRLGGWERFAPREAQVLVHKLGPAGALARTSAGTMPVAAHAVSVQNGLGAGDAFGAAVAEGLLRGRSLADTLLRASACGAIVVGRIPCAEASPSSSELVAFLSANPVPRPEELSWPWSPPRS